MFGTVHTQNAKYAVGLLSAIYAISYLDRTIFNTLAQLIRDDIKLTDVELGLLGGVAFAVFYAALGIPLARLADRYNRVMIISASLAAWSVMTSLCGLATSLFTLFLARVGVGIGEAGYAPAAHSLIADLFPPNRRASAFSMFALAVPIGGLIGVTVGGWLGQYFGWRTAFVAVSLPGIVILLLTIVTLREPKRGNFDDVSSERTPPFCAVVGRLFGQRAFIHLLAGWAICTIAIVGQQAFILPLVVRGNFGVNLAQISLVIGPVVGIASICGIVVGGLVTDWAAIRDKGAALMIPGACFLSVAPINVLMLVQRSFLQFSLLACVSNCILLVYIGPSFASIHNMVEPRMRASAIAVVYLVVNIVGSGLGPVLTGWLSDTFAAQQFPSRADWYSSCVLAKSASCRAASYLGLRSALIMISLLFVWGAFHYFRSGQLIRTQRGA